jgi:PHD/YefM family antitoxin component YafN of YafNO toxin-antitoxin module
MIELNREQHEALKQNGKDPLRVIDRASNVEYVLVRADVYERLKTLLTDDLPETAVLINEVMAEDDKNDPYLDSYQHYAREAP